MNYSPPIGELPEIRWVSCAAMRVDHAYQRMAEEPSSKRLIRHIAENWDWRLCARIGEAIDLEIDAEAESAALNECMIGEPTGYGLDAVAAGLS